MLLITMTLFSCNPDNPDDTTVKKVSIMGDSYFTFEGWSNMDVEGNPNEYFVYYPHEDNTNGNNEVSGLTRPYAKSIEKVCKHYGVTNIVLKDIEKTDGHPTYKGMQSICEQVYEVVRGS